MPTPRPSDLGLRRQVGIPLARAVLAHARRHYIGNHSAESVVRQLWPRDEQALRLVTRAPTTGANLTTAGWAPELGQNVIADLLVALGPASAASELLRRATMLTLDRFASITVPGLVASAQNASFVQEGMAISIRQLDTSKSVKLSPRKIATGFSLSREIIQSSNAEALVRMVMINSVALSLDAVLLGSAAGSSVQPPGLLYNIPPLTPSAGGGPLAFTADLAALAGAVSAVGALDLIFIASPAEAVKILLNAGPRFQFPVLASAGLAAKTVACFAPISVVGGAAPDVDIQESREALVQMDTAPGSDPMSGQSTKSMWQLDSSAFRVVFDVDWGLLNPGGAAIVSGVTW